MASSGRAGEIEQRHGCCCVALRCLLCMFIMAAPRLDKQRHNAARSSRRRGVQFSARLPHLSYLKYIDAFPRALHFCAPQHSRRMAADVFAACARCVPPRHRAGASSHISWFCTVSFFASAFLHRRKAACFALIFIFSLRTAPRNLRKNIPKNQRARCRACASLRFFLAHRICEE